MRHRKAGSNLGRTTSHRKAMVRNMLTSLFEHERVVTTEAKAKTIKPLAEKMITMAKRGDLHARRQVLSILQKKSVAHKLFAEIKDRYMERAGGYTSLVKTGFRRGDAAPMAVLELIKPEDKSAKKKAKKKKPAAKKTEAKAAPKEKAEAKAVAPAEPEAETKPETAEVEAAEAETAAVETPAETAETEAEPAAEEKAEGEEESK